MGQLLAERDPLVDFIEVIAARFTRREPRELVARYLRAILDGPARKNGWTLAAYTGANSPDGMQRLLRKAEWDMDGVRDDMRAYVASNLRADDGVWVIDETAFRKRGSNSVGVDRQYMRATGKTENCQVAVFLGYTSSLGEALVDRELYLPTAWIEDPPRCATAGVPSGLKYATKPQLGMRMLSRAHSAGLVHGWVSADKSYGAQHQFRSWLVNRELPFVLATNNDDVLTTVAGQRRPAGALAVRALDGEIASSGRTRSAPIPAGPYVGKPFDWIAIELVHGRLPPTWRHWLLVRRQTEPDPGTNHRKVACFRCAGPGTTTVDDLIRIAGARWTSDRCFRTARDHFGLGDYQVRDWRAWYAHVTLVTAAAGFQAVQNLPSETSGPPVNDHVEHSRGSRHQVPLSSPHDARRSARR
jgi:SRSO17 transposase